MTAKVMPVPRFLSSSCGTCVRFECENDMISDKMPEELEQIVEVQGKQYTAVYRVKE